MQLSEIYLYPIKSLGGISVSQAQLTDRGLQYDRRWMLVDESGKFLSQRGFRAMALLEIRLEGENMVVRHRQKQTEPLVLSLAPSLGAAKSVSIWKDEVEAHLVSPEADEWFSSILETPCHLVYMGEADHRAKKTGHLVSFADGYPHLIIGQSSLNYLNARLEEPVPMDRFRPNLVFTGGRPHAEDYWDHFVLGGVKFDCVKPCVRCQVPNIDQLTGQMKKEPNRTLAEYRQTDNKIMFGVNLVHEGEGKIAVGMDLEVVART
ncbi:MAG: MOSC N-terminal beta barrel domain-containing protein [Bacteroidota bacterium]